MARQIQGSDVKRDVDMADISRLIQGNQIYIASLSKTLAAAITAGDIGGGGGGGSVVWREGADAPVADFLNNFQIYKFGAGLSQKLYCAYKVPASYSAGKQIKLRMPFTSADTSGNVLFQTVATLIRDATDVISSTTNQRTSTNSAVTVSAGTVNEPQVVTFDLSSTIGEINSVAVAGNHIILVQFLRGTDTATGEANAFPDLSEITCNG